jgi:hypothetical protein
MEYRNPYSLEEQIYVELVKEVKLNLVLVKVNAVLVEVLDSKQYDKVLS